MGLKPAQLRIPVFSAPGFLEDDTITAELTGLLLLGLVTAAHPAGVLVAATPAPGGDGLGAAVEPLRDRSDAELTALAADWDALDRHQRRALLTEMKLRMARQGDRKGVIHIRTERRYGRLIRQADGRVIRIETQVVQVLPLAPEEVAAAVAGQRQGFGVGFEQRVARRAGEPGGAAPADPTSGERSSGEPSAEAVTAPQIAPPTIGEMLEGLESEPAQRAPLPIYQVADPAP